MSNNIYIISQPVQTGKTSLLFNWVEHLEHAAGILTPDINGKRKLYDISAKTYYNLQLNEDDPGVKIGRFTFDVAVLEKARQLIDKAQNRNSEWIIIDEIGRLEMDRKEGLEPAVGNLVSAFKKQQDPAAKLLLVIRDYLLDDAREYYQLHDAMVLPRAFFELPASSFERLTGLVLCGGKSVRMGRDKAFITYHREPQYAHIAELMKPLTNEVYISCRPEQKENISEQYQTITDNATLKNTGPIAGVLSAFETQKDTALLVTGCDYPHFTFDDMLSLAEAREEGIDVVCYRNTSSGFAEPLLAVYEKQCASLLLNYYREGNTSLRHFLATVNTRFITCDDRHLLSVDE